MAYAKSDAQQQLDDQLGGLLRQARELRGVAVETLALALGISKGAINHVESGRVSASVHLFLRIAAALDLDPQFLLQDLEVDTEPLQDWRAMHPGSPENGTDDDEN